MSRLWLAYRLGDAGLRALLRAEGASMGDGLMTEWDVMGMIQTKPRSHVKLARCVSPELYAEHAERLLRVIKWGATIELQTARMEAARRRKAAAMGVSIEESLERSKARRVAREDGGTSGPSSDAAEGPEIRQEDVRRPSNYRAPQPVRHIEPTEEQLVPRPAARLTFEQRAYTWRAQRAARKGLEPSRVIRDSIMRLLVAHEPTSYVEVRDLADAAGLSIDLFYSMDQVRILLEEVRYVA